MNDELYPGSIVDSRLDSNGHQYTGITHQAITHGGGAESFCGEWSPGDRMSLWSRDVTCPKCKSTSVRKP